MSDPVHHPAHYAGGHPVFPGECIEYTRHMGFDSGNAFKYLWRWNRKEIPLQDLNKSLWYLGDFIEHGTMAATIPDGSALAVRSLPPHLIERLHVALDEYSSLPRGSHGDDPDMSLMEGDVAGIQLAIARGDIIEASGALTRFIADYRTRYVS